MKPPKKDRYIIRKFIMARSVKEAIKLDAKTPVMECWLDEDWRKEHQMLASCVGFDDSFDEEE